MLNALRHHIHRFFPSCGSLLTTLWGCAAAWFVMSCTNAEDIETATTTPREISLSTYISQPMATRADSSMMAVNEIPISQSIGVYAYYHDNATWTTDDAAEPNFMFNQKATHINNTDPFTYSPLKYWPNQETDKLSFIAYYPYSNGTEDGTDDDINHTGIEPLLSNDASAMPSFTLTVKSNVKEQIDFMVSDLIPDLPQSRATDPDPGSSFDNLTITDRVRFNFKHALSKVELRIRVDNEIRDRMAYFTLHYLRLNNLYKEGTLTTAYTALDGTTFTWGNYGVDLLKDGDDINYYSCKTTEAYLLLPQTLGDAVNLSIGYDLAFKSDGTTYTYDASGNPVAIEEYVYKNRTGTVQLNTLIPTGSETPLTEWLPNHHYIYTIRIGAKAIEFTGQVVDWGDTVPIEGIELEEK